MNVKSKCIVKGKEIYFKTYFCKAPDAPWKHHIWSKLWCVHLLWTQLWTNKTQHTDIFSILHQVTASLFRTWCTLLNMEAQQHLTHSYNFKINSRSHQCQSTVMKAQFAMQLKLHVSFIFSTEWDKCSPSGSKDTAHSNHGVGPKSQLQHDDNRKSLPRYQTHV